MSNPSPTFSPNTIAKTFIVVTCFFFHVVNTVRVLKTPLNPTKMVSSPLHLAILHPSSLSHPYQFLEGSSLLSFIALHPDQFPPLDHLLLLGGRNSDLSSLTSFLLQSMLSLFPKTIRPKLRFLDDSSFSRQKNVCDRWMVFVSFPSNRALRPQLGRRWLWMLLRNAVFLWNDASGGICVRTCISRSHIECAMQVDLPREEPSSCEW